MTAVCCSGRCLGCCSCCCSRRARARRAQCSAVLPVLLVVLGAGYAAARGGTGATWSGWMLLGAALAGALIDALGRRVVLALSVPLQLAAALMQAFLPDVLEAVDVTDDLPLKLTVSACAGLAMGLALPTALFYLAELWRPSRRGAACCVPAVAAVAGRTLAYSMEAILELAGRDGARRARDAALVGVAPGGLALLLMVLVPPPPSPYWLALRGREVTLSYALARVRGVRDERAVRGEAEDVVECVREQRASLCAGNVRGPVLAVLLVGTLSLAGAAFLEAVLPALAAPLLADVGEEDAADAADAAWMVRAVAGGALMLAIACVAALADHAGRRPLALAACGLLAAGHGTVGFFHFFLGTPTPARGAALAWYITLGGLCAAALGVAALSTLSWLLLAELLPMRAKPLVPAVALLLDGVLHAVLDGLRLGLPWAGAPPDDAKVWPGAWLWAHALWGCLLALLIVVLLPETKGFSLPQLHEILRGPNRHNLQTRL